APMRSSLALAVALALATLGLSPLALAEVHKASTEHGGECVLADDDACAFDWTSDAPPERYAFALAGAFTGLVSMVLTDGVSTHSLTCSGTLAGPLMVSGGCSQNGPFPLAGDISVACTSAGSGVVSCVIGGA
ncbi:MAG TPA: hypothetical protein VM582_04985, partial [Candidatus Thermoplasmatota archaeon]|nr:hypothetical protein [Candidatus Thermoplasmatota archaeon]